MAEGDNTLTIQEKGPEELNHMAGDANDVLVKAENVFPFIMFPDTISIDRVKVTIIQRKFFRVAEVISIQIEDILNVESDIGPFFGSIKMWTRFFSTKKPLRINYLWRQDALKIKEVLQGYIIARNKKIDCSEVPVNKLVPMLTRLGQEAT